MHLTNKEPHAQSQNQHIANAELCRWCDSIFSPVTTKSVCDSGYKLLMGANLPDEEIFGDRRH